jgi:hypothetical protein
LQEDWADLGPARSSSAAQIQHLQRQIDALWAEVATSKLVSVEHSIERVAAVGNRLAEQLEHREEHAASVPAASRQTKEAVSSLGLINARWSSYSLGTSLLVGAALGVAVTLVVCKPH